MKKVIYILFLSLIVTSCDSLGELLELKVENSLTETIAATVPKTGNVPVVFNLPSTVDLNSGDLAQYKDQITAIKINSLTYKFKDFTGNTAGVISTGTLKFDDVVLGELANFNIYDAATAGTQFGITDEAKLNEIASNFVNNSESAVQLSGTVLSEAGEMKFNIEVFMDMTVTVKE
jgi:hypothetical protein